ncbi:hypothetical protein NL676_000935 [Syzygium grande]|nr:hypothetical protein NL676_000935 [Syzygium grande]
MPSCCRGRKTKFTGNDNNNSIVGGAGGKGAKRGKAEAIMGKGGRRSLDPAFAFGTMMSRFLSGSGGAESAWRPHARWGSRVRFFVGDFSSPRLVASPSGFSSV